jgi:hypothetical protein
MRINSIVKNDGFLLTVSLDREETSFAGVINIMTQRSLSCNWTIGAKLETSIPLEGRIEKSLAAVTLPKRLVA